MFSCAMLYDIQTSNKYFWFFCLMMACDWHQFWKRIMKKVKCHGVYNLLLNFYQKIRQRVNVKSKLWIYSYFLFSSPLFCMFIMKITKTRKERRKVEKKGQTLAWCNRRSKTIRIESGNQDRGHSFYYIYAGIGKSCNCSKFTFLTFKIRIIYNQILLDIYLMVEI